MTGIAAISDGTNIWMAGDSAGTEDHHYITLDAQPKVFQVDNVLIGFTTSFAMGRALQHRLKVPPLSNSATIAQIDKWVAVEFTDAVKNCLNEINFISYNDGSHIGGRFILGVSGLLYLYDDFAAVRVENGIAAVGAGVSVLYGALYATDSLNMDPITRLTLALEAASKYVAGVLPPFHIIRN